MAASVRLLFPVCKVYTGRTNAAVFWYIERDHMGEQYNIQCTVDGCPKWYTHVRSLKSHMRSHPTDTIPPPDTLDYLDDERIQTPDDLEYMDTEEATSEDTLKRSCSPVHS